MISTRADVLDMLLKQGNETREGRRRRRREEKKKKRLGVECMPQSKVRTET